MIFFENLVNPLTNEKIDIKDIIYFNGIPDLYYNDNNGLASIQSDFYNEVKFPNYDEIDDFGTLLEKSSKSPYIRKLDEEIPYNSNILEAGCGTGQLSIALSRFRRKVHSIDLSKGSLIEAKKFIDKTLIRNVQLYRMNIFKLCFPKNYFDVIISNGVLHHTHDAKIAFNKLTNCLKPNGIIVVGLYHKYGRIIQNLRQKLIKMFGEKFKFIDPRFSEDISFKKKYAWFKDQYDNPFETKHTYFEVINWFSENNIEFLNSIPFNYDPNEKLLIKKKILNKFKINLQELLLIFDIRQILEGGFFIMIGRKK